MAIKFFLMYLGAFLACSVILAMVVKQFSDSYAGQGKKPFIYGALSSLITSVVAYLFSIITNNLFTVFWCVTVLFIIFGIIHIRMVHKKYFYSYADDKGRVLIAEILFAFSIVFFTILIFSSLQYFLKGDRNFLFFPMIMSALGFFIPLMVMQTFEAAYDIPPPVFKTWEYPVNAPLDVPDEVPGEKLLVIGFELAKKSNDNRRTYFRAKTPEGIKLGELYFYFINDYNELQSETTIEYIKPNGEIQEWWFRLKTKWYQRHRILDPGITMRENKIIENSVIICERL